jgi:hypothetical protein
MVHGLRQRLALSLAACLSVSLSLFLARAGGLFLLCQNSEHGGLEMSAQGHHSSCPCVSFSVLDCAYLCVVASLYRCVLSMVSSSWYTPCYVERGLTRSARRYVRWEGTPDVPNKRHVG